MEKQNGFSKRCFGTPQKQSRSQHSPPQGSGLVGRISEITICAKLVTRSYAQTIICKSLLPPARDVTRPPSGNCATDESVVTNPQGAPEPLQTACNTGNCACPEPAPVQTARNSGNCAWPEPESFDLACTTGNCASPQPDPFELACDSGNCRPDSPQPHL